jgi:hypothetical protein
MKNIDEFLKKFTVIENPLNKKDEVLRILKTSFNINLNTEDVSIEKGVMRIQCHPTIKSHLFLKKDEILSTLNFSITDLNLKRII